MFEEGSDMETLVLKYNVGSESGIQEYAIDAIEILRQKGVIKPETKGD